MVTRHFHESMALPCVKYLLTSLCSCRKEGLECPETILEVDFAHCLCCFSLTKISSSNLSHPLPWVMAILANLVSVVCIFTLNELFISKSVILFGNNLRLPAQHQRIILLRQCYIIPAITNIMLHVIKQNSFR